MIKFFIDNYKFTIVLTLFAVIFGLRGLADLNAESFPTVNLATAIIKTVYEGASAKDIETKITIPIEDEIRTVDGIKDVKSVSQSSISIITVRVDLDNYNVDEVMSELERAVDRVSDLPDDLRDPPDFEELKSEEFPVIELAIIGDNSDRRRDKIADELKEDLEDNKDIFSVDQDGFKERNFQIFLDTQKLKVYHIGVNEVINAVRNRNVNAPAGHLKTSVKQDLIRIEGKIRNRDELADVLVRSNFSGEKVYLKDVARVEDSEEDPELITRQNGKDATVLIVTKKGGADTLELVADVDSRIEKFQKRYAGQFEFSVFNNESKRVKNRLEILTSNALSGLALVIIFLLIFLPGRVGIMASLSLPITVMATLGMMPMWDMNLNTVTISALVISLGMLVDNSVVIAENHARLVRGGVDSSLAALKSIQQLWLPITITALTTIAAFLPMLVTKGVMGQFIQYIPMIVTIALLLSLVEGFFLLPMRLVSNKKNEAVKKEDPKKSDWFQDKILPYFDSLVSRAVDHRYIALGVFSAALIGSLVMMVVFNKMILFPPDQTEIYYGKVEFKPGMRIEQVDRRLDELAKKVKEVGGPHMVDIITKAGTTRKDPMDPQAKSGNSVGLLTMFMDEEGKVSITPNEMLRKLREIPKDEDVDILTFEAKVDGPPVGAPVNATFRSNDMVSLGKLVKRLSDDLAAVNGVKDVQVDDVIGDDEIYVELDYVKANRLGLNVNSVGDTVRAALQGKIVSDVNLNNKDVEIVVRLDEKDRTSIESLASLEIMDNRGNLIPLGSFAKFDKRQGAPQIRRFDYKRSKTLSANVDEKVITAIEANAFVRKRFKELQLDHSDVSIVFGGEEENTKESMESLFNALILSLIGIFALLVFLFRSYLRPVIIMSTIPLGLVGFSVAFALQGRPISFMALIGVIGLGGIIVNSGIVLISFIDSLIEEGTPLREALIQASSIRLRAVVASALTTISGLLPTAYGIGGADPILEPMTMAMAWGLTSGTVLTLIWVPCAYAILEDVTRFFQRTSATVPVKNGKDHGVVSEVQVG